jgi:putative tryptophan/tyrosine transport system substrate-binding protein
MSVSRRRFVQGAGVAGLALLAGCRPLSWQAGPSTKLTRIGFLFGMSQSRILDRLVPFREGLRESGYIEGQNVEIEVRSADGEYQRLPGLAVELVGLQVDILVTESVPAAVAAQQATQTIPIVTAGMVDPVLTGLVASLAHPGGNITGPSLMAPVLVAKQLQLLKEMVPDLSHLAVLWNAANAGNDRQLQEVERAVGVLGVRLQSVEVRGANDLGSAFIAMTSEQADGLVVLFDAMLIDHRAQITDLASATRIPAAYGLRDYVEAGGLMSYAANISDVYRRAAYYVDRILKGTKPADLPVEQPTTFEFIVNLKTAHALGLTIPQHVLLQATEVIQ